MVCKKKYFKINNLLKKKKGNTCETVAFKTVWRDLELLLL